MIIENTTTKGIAAMTKRSAELKNNSNYQQLQNILNSNSDISTIAKNETNQNPDDLTKHKIEDMKALLRSNQASEKQLQNEMTILQEKELALEKIKAVGDKLKDLSDQYTKSNLSETDRSEIEKQAGELLDDLGSLMNTGKNNMLGDKLIQIDSSDGNSSVLFSKSIDIILDFSKSDVSNLSTPGLLSNKHFINKLSVQALLENPSIIQEKLLNPVQKDIEEVTSKKSIIYEKFSKEYSSALGAISGLYKLGAIDGRTKNDAISSQNASFDAISALRFQSSNINKNNVAALLR